MIKLCRDQKYFTKCKYIVDLYLSPKCDFKCSYCYVKEDYPDLKTLSLDTAFYFIDCVSLCKDVCLSLIGGEPTLYKDLNVVIEYAENKVAELELYTNGSTDLSKFKLDNVKTVLSIHPRYYNKFRNRFLSNIQYLQDHNLKHQIRLMMENSDLSEILKDLKNVSILKEYLYDPNGNFFILPDNYVEDKDFQAGDELIGISEYIKKYFKSKKPFLCKMNSFAILSNGDVEKYCYTDDGLIGNLFVNKNLFRDLKIKIELCKQSNTLGCSEMEIIRFV